MKSDRRLLIFISLLIITPLGILSKKYTGIGQQWVRDYSGDILYEIFWCLVVFWLIPQAKVTSQKQVNGSKVQIALWVFAITCAIEISQLWFYLVPVAIRSSLVWRLLLGSAFVWWDFPHYALGSFLGWLWMVLINKIELYKS